MTTHHLFPEAWIYGQLYVMKSLSRLAYLSGEISDGFWSYYPVAFAVKTPLPTIILLVVGVGMSIFRRRERMAKIVLLVPVAVFFLFAVWSKINIGLRHILPIYPFLFVLIGGTAAALWKSGSRIKRGGLILLSLWYLWAAFSIYPHYLAYFNELIGGPKNGHKVLLDSNLDWGQDLKGLKRWMDGHGVKKIRLIYFGTAYPKYYGIDAFHLPGDWIEYDSPADETAEGARYLAISGHLLHLELLEEDTKELVKKLKSRAPVAIIGYSIYVYALD